MAEIIKLDGTRQLDFDREMVEQAYDRWAPVYDLVFGGVFSKGRKAMAAATKIGGRVLESASGTGISLPQFATSHLRHRYFWRRCCKGQACGRASDEDVENLAVMDAEAQFPDFLRRRDGAICRDRGESEVALDSLPRAAAGR
jgi:phosphatidylethanolamine/phosphatidyl-N-methylethanolamine N-methyltransferase